MNGQEHHLEPSENRLAQLRERIRSTEARIAAACARAGRARNEIGVIAVTKYVSVETAALAVAEGLTHAGENRVQDALPKLQHIGDKAVWHFIGHLQSNKVKDVVGRFAYIHSLDRLSLAKEINRIALNRGLRARCFLQVNVSGEETKHGLRPEQLIPFAAELANLPGIEPIGLMTMAPYEAEPEATRPVFRGLRELRDELNARAVLPDPVRELSMGMSNDFEIAIEEGATWIRLGSVLVGRE